MHFSCFLLFCVCWLWACVCVWSCVSSCSFSFNPFPFLFFLCVAFLNFFCFHFVCIFLVVFKTFFNKLLINNWKVFEIKMCMANDLPLRFLSFFFFSFFFLISFIFCLLFCSCFFFLLVLCIFFSFSLYSFLFLFLSLQWGRQFNDGECASCQFISMLGHLVWRQVTIGFEVHIDFRSPSSNMADPL